MLAKFWLTLSQNLKKWIRESNKCIAKQHNHPSFKWLKTIFRCVNVCLWWIIKKQLLLKVFKKIDLLHIVSIVVLMKRNFSDEVNPFFAATPSSEDPNLLSTDPRSLFGDSDDSDWEGLDGGMIVIWARAWQNQQNDLCAQQRLGSTWASAQSDQSLHCALYGY